MAEVDLNIDNDTDRMTSVPFLDSHIRLADREDQETIRKVKELQMPSFPNLPSGTSLTDRVTEGRPSMIEAGTPAGIFMEELKKGVVNNSLELDVDDTNYIIKIQHLVAKILEQLSDINDKDRTQIERLKTNYQQATLEAANLQRSLGSNELKSSVFSLLVSFTQFLSPHKEDRECANLIAQQVCPKLAEYLFGANTRAELQIKNSFGQLLISEYQAKTSKGQENASNKQEIVSTLEKALNNFAAAARGS